MFATAVFSMRPSVLPFRTDFGSFLIVTVVMLFVSKLYFSVFDQLSWEFCFGLCLRVLHYLRTKLVNLGATFGKLWRSCRPRIRDHASMIEMGEMDPVTVQLTGPQSNWWITKWNFQLTIPPTVLSSSATASAKKQIALWHYLTSTSLLPWLPDNKRTWKQSSSDSSEWRCEYWSTHIDTKRVVSL